METVHLQPNNFNEKSHVLVFLVPILVFLIAFVVTLKLIESNKKLKVLGASTSVESSQPIQTDSQK